MSKNNDRSIEMKQLVLFGCLFASALTLTLHAADLVASMEEVGGIDKDETALTVYHVHPDRGDDNNSGLSVDHAWKTLEHALRRVRGGETIRLHGVFKQSFRPKRSFMPSKPIKFQGPAMIDSRGENVALELRGVSGYIFEDINFRTMSRDLPEEVQRRPYQVVFLVRGANYNIFIRCRFMNAGLGSGKAVVAMTWGADHNVFRECTAIAESIGKEAFGRRCWLIAGSSNNMLLNCMNYGSAAATSIEGEGVGITIYGSRNDKGKPMPCIGNRVLGHRSFNVHMYGMGITAGSSWCRDNWYENCVTYADASALAGAYANAFASREGCEPDKCQNNGWKQCTVIGGQRGYWSRGMKDCHAIGCTVIAETDAMHVGFELTSDPEDIFGAASLEVSEPVLQGVWKQFKGSINIKEVVTAKVIEVNGNDE